MSVIDRSTWKPFRVGDLFETHVVGKKVACPTGGAIAKARLLGGDTPRVTVSGVDNGIVGYFKDVDDANYRVYKNCISVSFLGTVFYQKKPTSFDMKVHVLQRDDLNEARGLYLASIIRKTIANFDYAAQLSSSMLPDIEIMLPATPDGEPDWAYMESYMRDVMDREEIFAEHLASLTAEAVADGHVIDTSRWKAFRVGGLFDVVSTRGVNTYGIQDDGNVPYIAASRENNGCSKYVTCDDEWVSSGNCLVFVHIGDAAAGVCHYVDKDFVGMKGKTSCAYNEHINPAVGLFLASVITKNNDSKYSFSQSWTGKDLLDTEIMLPATPDGDPDWAYMEQYMKDVMAVEALFADELDCVYCS